MIETSYPNTSRNLTSIKIIKKVIFFKISIPKNDLRAFSNNLAFIKDKRTFSWTSFMVFFLPVKTIVPDPSSAVFDELIIPNSTFCLSRSKY